MTDKEEFVRKWGVDLVICLDRFKAFNKAIDRYVRSAGANKKDGLIFDYLTLEGNERINLVPHPYVTYADKEKEVFEQCFGKPLEVPKKLLMNITLKDFLKTVNERGELIRECLAYTSQSRFRNFQAKKKNDVKAPVKKKPNYKKKYKPKRRG